MPARVAAGAAFVAAVAATSLVLRTDRDHTSLAGTGDIAGAPSPAGVVFSSVTHGIDPELLKLSPEEQLRRLAAADSVQGAVEGTVLGDESTLLVEESSGRRFAYTDVRFEVSRYIGRGPAPYADGEVIVLRWPGGTVGNTRYVTSASTPKVKKGMRVFALVADHGVIGGGTGPGRLVVTDFDDLFEIRDGRVYRTGGRFAQLNVPVSVFEGAFSRS